jgi:hypothetical protein
MATSISHGAMLLTSCYGNSLALQARKVFFEFWKPDSLNFGWWSAHDCFFSSWVVANWCRRTSFRFLCERVSIVIHSEDPLLLRTLAILLEKIVPLPLCCNSLSLSMKRTENNMVAYGIQLSWWWWWWWWWWWRTDWRSNREEWIQYRRRHIIFTSII